MPRGRMQHAAALPHAAKVARHMPPMRSRPHEKKYFADLLQVTKTMERDRQTRSDFFSNWLIPF